MMSRKHSSQAIDPETLEVDEVATKTLRAEVEREESGREAPLYDRARGLQPSRRLYALVRSYAP